MLLDINRLDPSWHQLIRTETSKPYFQQLENWVTAQRNQTTPIYPPANQVFRALELTPLANTKVVILGQDPYHGENQANGLCFAVNRGIAIPPSLRNIYKELHNSMNINKPTQGDLTCWATQGVLLLNTVLTVAQGLPQSHQNQGWEIFTDEVIKHLNLTPQPIVFLLWGAPARKKIKLIDIDKHYVLEATHPSPLSAHRGFLGCNHFVKANELLNNSGRGSIDWAVN